MLFAEGPSIHARLFIAVMASIALLTMDQISVRLAPIRATLSLAVDPIKYMVDLPVATAGRISNSLKSYSTLEQENLKLRETQAIDQIRLLKYDALEKENIRLRALLENSFKLGEQVLIAELLSVNISSPYENIVVVNKGTRFGVHIQQAVVDANGVVGQVFRALPQSSEIMLITDPNHAIPVQVNRNGLLTIAVGTGELNRLKLPFLPDNADVQAGDLLITSGLGGTFPQGYPVAVVDPFTPPANKQVTATPKASLDRNRELMIVWSNTKPIALSPAQAPIQNEVEGHTNEQ
ncbi:MAG: rod shape-determining protein MreC [Methyloglobulus sp.]